MKKITKYKNGVRRSWFFSYLIVVGMILLITSVNYILTHRLLKNEIDNSRSVFLRQTQSTIDISLKNIEDYILSLIYDKEVVSCSASTNFGADAKAFRVKQLQNGISTQKALNRLMKECYLYFPKSDHVVYSTNSYKRGLLKSRMLSGQEISYSEWEEIRGKSGTNDFLFFSLKAQGKFALIRTLPLSGNEEVCCAVLLDQAYLDEFLRQNLFQDGAAIALRTDDRHILFSTLPALNPMLEAAVLSGEETILTDATGEKQIISTLPSLVESMSYLYSIPQKVYTQPLHSFLLIILITLISSTLVAVIIGRIFSVRNYRPVESILTYLHSSSLDSPPISLKSEYGEILLAIQNHRETISDQQTLLQERLLHALLIGDLKGEEAVGALALSQLKLGKGQWGCLLLTAPDMGPYFQEMSAGQFFYAIKNVFDELLQSTFSFRHTVIGRSAVYLLKYKDGSAYAEQRLDSLLDTGFSFFQTQFKFQLFAAVSFSETGISPAVCFAQARDELEWGVFFSERKRFFQSPTSADEDCSTVEFYASPMDTHLREAVLSGKAEPAENLLHNTLALLQNGSCRLRELHSFLFLLSASFIKLNEEINARFRPMKDFKFQYAGLLCQCPTARQIEALASKDLRSAAIQIAELGRSPTTDEVSRRVAAYIQENFANPNLNVNFIGNLFNFNPSYLSKNFKFHIGESINNYIGAIRIQEAKRLLESTGLKIGEISVQTGFSDPNTFIRTFKKLEGSTPGAYLHREREMP